jgi:chorismate synthase
MISKRWEEMFLAGNSLGKEFVATVFGESHGRCIGTIVDGCPAGLELNAADVQRDLDRRIPRGTSIVSSRIEMDKVDILSGVFRGHATGAPIAMVVWNRDVDSRPYELLKDIPRPGHADYPARIRYRGFNDYRGGGQISGRTTVAFVMAGVVAKKILRHAGIEVLAHSQSIGKVSSRTDLTLDEIRRNVYSNPVRSGDHKAASSMEQEILSAAKEGDSIGGTVKAIVSGVPPGIGDPIFNSLDSELSRALFSIPAVKGVEFGAGFDAARLKGSQNNDRLAIKKRKVTYLTNRAGGILGGLSSGAEIVAHVAFKPTPSIHKPQRSVNLRTLKQTKLRITGRHDPCVVPKAVPVVEAIVAIVLADFALRSKIISTIFR